MGKDLAMRSRKVEPIRIAAQLRECPGKWVALLNGEVVDVRETPDALVMALREREIEGAVIIRAPSEHEPEMVGLG